MKNKKFWGGVVVAGAVFALLADGFDLGERFWPSSSPITIESEFGNPQPSTCGVVGAAVKGVPDINGRALEEVTPLLENKVRAWRRSGGVIFFSMGGEGSYAITDVKVIDRGIPEGAEYYLEAGLGCGAAGDAGISLDYDLENNKTTYRDSRESLNEKKLEYFPEISVHEGGNVRLAISFNTCTVNKKN